ncbi:MAG TPA: hypothetical protein VLB84_10155, partial [Bacteroidia bacterium]|nr:hypothetical protein [Bacteroidia bacterium]
SDSRVTVTSSLHSQCSPAFSLQAGLPPAHPARAICTSENELSFPKPTTYTLQPEEIIMPAIHFFTLAPRRSQLVIPLIIFHWVPEHS